MVDCNKKHMKLMALILSICLGVAGGLGGFTQFVMNEARANNKEVCEKQDAIKDELMKHERDEGEKSAAVKTKQDDVITRLDRIEKKLDSLTGFTTNFTAQK